NFRCNLCCDCWYRVDVLVGGRYLDLNESLGVQESVQEFSGTLASVADRFGTRNQFGGPQAGLSAQFQRGQLFLDLFGKISLGETRQVVQIAGSQVVTNPGMMPMAFTGGLLALATNIGTFRHDSLSFVPELGINVGYQITPRVRAYAGYSLLYWTSVLRPGDQVDLSIDQALIPNFNPAARPTGLHRPMVPFKESDYWAQGFNFGLEISY